jgi:hypothetical protein
MATLLEEYRSSYTATQDEVMSLEDYLDLCKQDPSVYASPAERMLAGIGEPEVLDTRSDPRLGRIFGNRTIRRYPRVPRILRHGGGDRPDRRVLQACSAGPRRAQADPVSARSRGRRQIVDRRTPESGDGAAPDLRDQGLAGERIAARAVRGRALRCVTGKRVRHPAPLPHTNHVAVGGETPSGIQRGLVKVSSGTGKSFRAAPGCNHEDRTR